MPDFYDMASTLDKAFEVAARTQKSIGAPPPDEASFVMGFVACFGIITGAVDIGLPQDAPLDQILDSIHRDIIEFGRRVANNLRIENEIRDKINGFKH